MWGWCIRTEPWTAYGVSIVTPLKWPMKGMVRYNKNRTIQTDCTKPDWWDETKTTQTIISLDLIVYLFIDLVHGYCGPIFVQQNCLFRTFQIPIVYFTSVATACTISVIWIGSIVHSLYSPFRISSAQTKLQVTIPKTSTRIEKTDLHQCIAPMHGTSSLRRMSRARLIQELSPEWYEKV